MSAGKIASNIILGLLLFLSLLLLGPANAVQSTVLNTAFVEKQLNNLDVDAVVQQEVLTRIDRIPGFDRYASLSEAVKKTLLEHEDEIKSRLLDVVAEAHRYVVEGGQFDLAVAVRSQVLDPELGKTILADVNLKPLALDLLKQMVPSMLSSYNIGPYLEAAVPTLESWLKGKFIELLPGVYDYLFSGGSPPGNVSMPVSDIIEQIRLVLREAFVQSPPLEALNIPVSALGITFDTGWAALKQYLPHAIEIDLTTNLGAPLEYKSELDEANDAIHQARPWVQRMQAGFWVLLVFTFLLVIAILVINLEFFKISSLTLGTAAALSGLVGLIGGLVAQSLARQAVLETSLPSSIEPWLLQLISGLFRPQIIFAIACLATGAILLVAGFVFWRARRSDLKLRVETGTKASL